MISCIERSLVRAEHNKQEGTFLFCFAASEKTFEGHFPGHPILPGVFQLEMVRFSCEQVASASLDVARVNKASFTRPILPEEEVLVKLTIQPHDEGLLAQSTLSVSGEKAGKCALILREAESRQ